MALNRDQGIHGNRYYNITILVIILMAILAIRLFVVAILQHEKWSKIGEGQSTKYIYTPAPRGNIYDKNGKLLAGNRQIFTLQFATAGLKVEEINDSALKLYGLIEKNGDKYEDDFPIVLKDDGSFSYTFDEDKASWLSENGFSSDTTPEQAFNALRNQYQIDSSQSRYKALNTLGTVYGVYPPIAVKNMSYTYDLEKIQFIKDLAFTKKEIEEGMSAKECFESLRKKYKIDNSVSDLDARKIMGIRYKVISNGYTNYIPTTIAKKISINTIASVEENGIAGASVSTEMERYYPYGTVACHIIGYMGRISSVEIDKYVNQLKYSKSEMIGKYGIEGAYEEELHGKNGVKAIRVDRVGRYVSTISDTPAKKGKDIYLTIDVDVQMAMENGLKDHITGKEKEGTNGASVALDTNTGQVVAMASYPVFDPNMFADGISTSEWASVQRSNPRDLYGPAPLVNVATSVSLAPGSAFKPITSLAALEKGLNPNRIISDKGHIDLGGTTWGCYTWNTYKHGDGPLNMTKALGVSCNYYIYCISDGKDYGTGQSLGYTLSINELLDMGKRLGLNESTGIEINESTVSMPSEEISIRNHKAMLWNAILAGSSQYFDKSVTEDREKLEKNINKITSWIDENPSFNEVINRIKNETDVKKSQVTKLATMVKFDYFNQAKWNLGDKFNLAIGQGDNRFTPLQMARYIAAVGNKGILNKVTLIKGIEDKGLATQKETRDANLRKQDISAVFSGMREVFSRGVLGNLFNGLDYRVIGKTGTAENQSIRQPADEMNYIKTRLSSFNSQAGTDITWEQVLSKIKELRQSNPNRFPTDDDTVDSAVYQLSEYKITSSMINKDKGKYNPNTWMIALAPMDDPQLAVATVIIEGESSVNIGKLTKGVFESYFNSAKSENYSTSTSLENGSNTFN